MRQVIELIRKHPKMRRILRCESPSFHHWCMYEFNLVSSLMQTVTWYGQNKLSRHYSDHNKSQTHLLTSKQRQNKKWNIFSYVNLFVRCRMSVYRPRWGKWTGTWRQSLPWWWRHRWWVAERDYIHQLHQPPCCTIHTCWQVIQSTGETDHHLSKRQQPAGVAELTIWEWR